MVKTEKSQEKFFRVSLSDMQTVVLSDSAEEAAAAALTKFINEYGKHTNISFIMSVEELLEDSMDIEIFHTSRVLENIGHFELAKNVETLSKILLDKSGSMY